MRRGGTRKQKSVGHRCPDPKCGHTRFRTIEKQGGVRLSVACRKCGAIVGLTEGGE